MSQKINQLVTDCVRLPSKKENKVESEPLILSGNVSEDKKKLDDLSRDILEKSIRILDSRQKLENKKFRVIRVKR
jgi:hypothetical protein